MVAIAVYALKGGGRASFVCVPCDSTLGAYICCRFTLISAVVKLITFLTLEDWFILLNVYVVGGNDL